MVHTTSYVSPTLLRFRICLSENASWGKHSKQALPAEELGNPAQAALHFAQLFPQRGHHGMQRLQIALGSIDAPSNRHVALHRSMGTCHIAC